MASVAVYCCVMKELKHYSYKKKKKITTRPIKDLVQNTELKE